MLKRLLPSGTDRMTLTYVVVNTRPALTPLPPERVLYSVLCTSYFTPTTLDIIIAIILHAHYWFRVSRSGLSLCLSFLSGSHPVLRCTYLSQSPSFPSGAESVIHKRISYQFWENFRLFSPDTACLPFFSTFSFWNCNYPYRSPSLFQVFISLSYLFFLFSLGNILGNLFRFISLCAHQSSQLCLI